MNKLQLIIAREYLARVKNKTFLIMTFLSPLIMVGMIFFIAYLTSLNSDDQKTIALHDQSGVFLQEFDDTDEVTYLNLSDYSLKQSIDSVQSKNYNALIYFPKNKSWEGDVVLYSKKSPGISFVSDIEQKVSTILTEKRLISEGVDLEKIDRANTKVSLQIENFEGKESSKLSNYIKMFFGGAAGYLLMMFIIIYGNMVMRSVIEEKTNRIVEIVVSSVKPLQLMLGKITGTSLAGLTQFSIWVFFGGLLLIGSSYFFNVDMASNAPAGIENVQQGQEEIQKIITDIANLPLGKLVFCFLFYFLGGYFLYSSFYAAIGAAVDSDADTQQFMFPLIVPLMLGIYVGFFSVIENPHGTVSVIFSHIPLTSSVVMLMRIPFGVAWWEILISMAILLLSVFFTIWLASKIYRTGILMYGKKPTYKDLVKWLRL